MKLLFNALPAPAWLSASAFHGLILLDLPPEDPREKFSQVGAPAFGEPPLRLWDGARGSAQHLAEVLLNFRLGYSTEENEVKIGQVSYGFASKHT